MYLNPRLAKQIAYSFLSFFKVAYGRSFSDSNSWSKCQSIESKLSVYCGNRGREEDKKTWYNSREVMEWSVVKSSRCSKPLIWARAISIPKTVRIVGINTTTPPSPTYFFPPLFHSTMQQLSTTLAYTRPPLTSCLPLSRVTSMGTAASSSPSS